MSAQGVWLAPALHGRGYAVALAGMPLHAHEAREPRGAVAVVGGRDGRAGVDALEAGAVGLVITDAQWLSAADARAIVSAAGSVPVIVDRPLLRPDMLEQAVAGRRGAPALMVTAEVRTPDADAEGALRDVLGWARGLAGDSFEVVTAGGTRTRFGALLESTSGRLPLVLTVTKATRDARSPELHVTVLGETRSEVRLDPRAGVADVRTVDGDGDLVAPTRHEGRERVALRRCLEALRGGVRPDDLPEFAGDAETSARLTASVTGHKRG